MIDISTPEYLKSELVLGLDSFDKPKTLKDVGAWSQLILNLLFLLPGTYPSLPNMGIGLQLYEYDFLDDAIDEISAKIEAQQQEYLPDIPLSEVNVTKYYPDNSQDPILLISLTFTTNENGSDTSVIALNTKKNRFIEFEISWD